MEVTIDGETRTLGTGVIAQIRKGAVARMTASTTGPARHVAVESLPILEARVD